MNELIKIDDIKEMAVTVSKSNLFAIKDPHHALALMLLCQAEGLHPMQACRQYHVINGRASMTSQTMMAKFFQAGGTQEINELNDKIADITLTHPAGGSVRLSWTIEQAKLAGLADKDVWKKHPRSMLLRRAQSEAVRAVAPFVLEGLPSDAEAEEIQPLVVQKVETKKEDSIPYQLDVDLPLPVKAKVFNKIKDINGSVNKKGLALIPESKFGEFVAYVEDVTNSELYQNILENEGEEEGED